MSSDNHWKWKSSTGDLKDNGVVTKEACWAQQTQHGSSAHHTTLFVLKVRVGFHVIEPALGAGHTDGGILQPTAPQWFETTLIKGRTDYWVKTSRYNCVSMTRWAEEAESVMSYLWNSLGRYLIQIQDSSHHCKPILTRSCRSPSVLGELTNQQ